MSTRIEPQEIEQMDLYTIKKIFCMVSDLQVKNFTTYQNKYDYDKGKDYAYRNTLGQLSGLIERKKVVTKIVKQREKRKRIE